MQIKATMQFVAVWENLLDATGAKIFGNLETDRNVSFCHNSIF